MTKRYQLEERWKLGAAGEMPRDTDTQDWKVTAAAGRTVRSFLGRQRSAAARVIQATWQGCRVRAHLAARTLQSAWRGNRARLRCLTLTKRERHAMRLTAYRRNEAARRIQAAWREQHERASFLDCIGSRAMMGRFVGDSADRGTGPGNEAPSGPADEAPPQSSNDMARLLATAWIEEEGELV